MSRHLPRFLVRGRPAAGELVPLDATEAKHARVRRLAPGAAVVLFDGAGYSCHGSVASVSRSDVHVAVEAVLPEGEGESPLHLTLALAVLKSDRWDWVIEKVTELGVSRILPFTSRHSLAQPSPARRARWPQIALAAAKQCGRSAVPEVAAPVDFSDAIATRADLRIFFWEGEADALAAAPGEAPRSLLAVVGPEGGFAAAEVELARAAGCTTAGLGARVLRADTAALTAVALCQHLWGDLRG